MWRCMKQTAFNLVNAIMDIFVANLFLRGHSVFLIHYSKIFIYFILFIYLFIFFFFLVEDKLEISLVQKLFA